MTLLPVPPPIIPPALAGMAAWPQWICWDLIQRPGKPKPDKVPTDPRTRLAINPHLPQSHMSSTDAVAWAKHTGLGLGFVFTELDPYSFLDLDGCAITDPNGTATWAPYALQLLTRLSGAAVETSCSGRGLHVFGRCAPGLLHGTRNAQIHAELYTSKRFVALGYNAQGNCDLDITEPLTAIAQEFFPPPAAGGDLAGVWTDEARPGTGIPDNDLLLKQATKSRSANATFGDGARFKDLFEGNVEALERAFPDPSGMRPYDESRADAALAAHLAFWTGDNCQQIWDIMWQSALVRPKWYDRDDYVVRTIMSVLGTQHDVYTGKHAPVDTTGPAPEPPPGAPGSTTAPPPAEAVQLRELTTTQFVALDQMAEMWRDYVYVSAVNRVLTPKGDLFGDSQFKNTFSRRIYPYQLNGGTTTNAWKAYIESECYDFPKAEYLRFLPGVHQRVVTINGDTYANAWSDPRPARRQGDAKPFTDHIHRLLPRGDDALKLIAYMAACVQHQGIKFTWCPLIQGVQGNGKSTIAKVLEHAIGEKYVHVMKGGELFAKFNSWLASSVVVAVHDMNIGGGEQMDKIKPIITESRQQIERKGVDQTTEHICCNFLLTTNHQDAIPLERAERRFATFFCAQQRPGDLKKHGLTEPYFHQLFDWLDNHGGYEIVAEFLWTYQIPDELNPATHCKTAPETTSREEALEASLTPVAQLIVDAIESEEPGFCGGWVSSLRVTHMLKEHGIKISPRKLGLVLEDLGFEKHPKLPNGKATRLIPHEYGKRPRLYVKEGHLSLNLDGASEVIEAYEKAQGYPEAKIVPLPDGKPKK